MRHRFGAGARRSLASSMAAAPATIGAGPAKLKIKIKGLSVLGAKQKAQQQQVSTGLPNGVPAVIGDQLADLHAAVEAFCQQGLRGLPGAVLLAPWREPSPLEQLAPWGEPLPLQEQQGNEIGIQPQQQLQEQLSPQPGKQRRVLPPEDRPVRSQEEALAFLQGVMEKAKQLKHQGDRRYSSLGGWDVFGLSFYALSSVEFLMYWDTLQRLLAKLSAAGQPVDKLRQLHYNLAAQPFLRQTGNLSITGMNACMNCKGPDVAKLALRMLLERISAISHLRSLHNQRKQLEGHIRLLKTNGASLGSGSSNGAGSSARPAAAAPQQQQPAAQQQQQAARLQAQRAVAAAAAAAGKPRSPSGSSWSPAGAQQQQQFNKRSPDDSNASNQERVQLPVGGEHAAGTGGAAGAAAGGAAAQGGQTERVLALAKSERALMESMQELLKLTDSMHQTVMRIQQFLERPEVLASEHARAAALHISVLGLDAGMFSIPRVAAHTEAAVTCITKLLRSS
ncbi:hypothetical protein OEZ86_005325 [Tetradesmus obliquus]|nr:hypothetical protein OEZ86_005325 [Tetradesmus obliquus]